MRAKLALMLLSFCVIWMTACAGEGSTTTPSSGTPPGGGTGPTLAFITTTLPAATENTQYTAIIKAVGSATGSYSWNIGSGTPTGSFSSGSGLPDELVISGIFTPAGSYTFSVTVGDFGSQSVMRNYTIVVNASTSIALVAMPYTGAWEDQAFQTQFYAQGGTQPFTWTMPSGTLPSGLSLTPQNSFADLPAHLRKVANSTSRFASVIPPASLRRSTINSTFSLRAPGRCFPVHPSISRAACASTFSISFGFGVGAAAPRPARASQSTPVTPGRSAVQQRKSPRSMLLRRALPTAP